MVGGLRLPTACVEEGFDEFVADEGVEAGEGFVEDDERGAEGEDAGEGGLHALAAGEVFELAVEWEVEAAGVREGGSSQRG